MAESKSLVVYDAVPVKEEPVHRGVLLFVLVLGAFIAILNQTLLNVAIPHLMNDFNVSSSTIQWLSTAYMLVNGIVIPISAYLIGTFTTRQLFLGAMISFTVGSLICGVAPTFSVMLIGRIVQGLGAGIIMPLMMTVILNIFPPETRGRSMGMIGIAMFFAPAVGPTLSGWIIEHWSWRILFYVAMPLAIADIILAYFLLKNVTKKTNPLFDFWGFLTSTVGLGFLLYGCSEAGSKGWGDAIVDVSLIIGAIALVLFIIRELTTPNPMLNLRVFKFGIFTTSVIVSCIVNMAMFGATILVPIYVQNIRGFSAMDSGLLMLPGALLMGVMSPVTGALMDKVGARPLAIIGLTITAVTTWELSKLGPDTTYHSLMLLYTLRMFGMSFIAMTIMTAGLNQIPRELVSHATAASNTARQVAASLGTALLVTVMSNRSTFHLGEFSNTMTSTNPNLVDIVQKLGAGFAAKLGIPADASQGVVSQMLYGLAVKQSTIMGINDAFVVATVLTVIALVCSFFLKRVKLDKAPAVKTELVPVPREQQRTIVVKQG
ncbi:DHA2 family efflux MFS transporter permease subunit [Paenibacillus aurantius]|uniref:DHA2 family efflux MFS transporter permease subunit n=1 Tax=Paenibacillus aurantius TaxID=2918900 RepID=A0AA96RHR4_9BACL|nr:DHA2 family efflux MFS transporter permease subunit [Paenibacillus aurantius]WNQ13826.1 DHA2 family efflux MFS transporter permease subunit [Paenibacillus aurantius]